MINTKNKLYGVILISVVLILIGTIVNAKYIIENRFDIANIDIDRTKPIIEIINIENSNIGYENYANKTHKIDITVKIKDKNLEKVFWDKEHVKIKINDKYVEIKNIEFIKLQDLKQEKIYKIKLSNINENGKLGIEVINGTAIDTSKLENDKLEFDTNIVIDNIAPSGIFQENKIEDGKVQAIINLSENIRKLDGWEFSEDKLKIEKEFTNNVSYELPIVDYAGNKSIVNIDIVQATYINIIYASHNSVVGWTFGYGNYDIAGEEAIKEDPIHKTEALAFNISGNVDDDFVQASSYIYTYWGEGSKGKCMDTSMVYNYGYNPENGIYKSMKSDDLVTINGKKYFQFGGSGINSYENGDINGNDIIPIDISIQYLYGICGINFRLKDYSQFSVVYQIFVDKVGWINACSDGQECMYDKVSPMSAFRIALIPKSEKQYVIDTWNKDIGSYDFNR